MCIHAGSAGRPAEDTACACLYSRTCHSTKLLQMCAVPSLHLPAFTRLVQLWLRNPDWRPRNHAQRVLMTLCLSVVHVQLDTGWSECTYVYEPKVLVFSHESERQEILTGQLCVSTNINILIKNRVEKILKVGQRFLHMQLNISVNNSPNSRRARCSTCVKGEEWNLPRDLCYFITCRTGESNMTTFIHTVVKRQLGPLQCY